MATNSVNTDWNSVLSTAQAGLTSTQNQIRDLEAQAAPLRTQVNDAKEAYEAQSSFYKAALEKYRPNPVLSEILPLQEAYQKDPTNAAKKAAWETAKAKFDAQVAKQDQETGRYPGIIQGLYDSYRRAQDRYRAVYDQLPPLYTKEEQYQDQINEAKTQLNTQKTGTTPANTTTVSATNVPASNKPGNASIATTTTTTTTIESSNKSSLTVTKTTQVTANSDPGLLNNDKPLVDANGVPTSSSDPSINKLLKDAPLVDAAGNPTSNADPSINALLKDTPPLVDVNQIVDEAQNLKVELPEIEPDPTYGEIYSAESQATEQDQANFAAKADWRVRLSLAPDSQYLYNANEPGILKPLKETDGVVFPYTPAISVNYAASYETTSLVHNNYKVFQYSGSGVDQVSISCTFTAQDEYEANYLLAVIHFFRSMTKMFYGQDDNPKNGTPPPLAYMFGMGGYQFAAHPLAIQGFSYNLPDDVDYIKTTSESPAGSPKPSTYSPSEGRLAGTGVQKGGKGNDPAFSSSTKKEAVTYVPTRIQMTITCVPIMSRNAVSNRFSLRDYASGKLVLGTREPGGGMW